jgi:hypothetical protein
MSHSTMAVSVGRALLRRLAFLALIAAAFPCAAEDWVLHLGGVSHHFRSDGSHEDFNPGLGLEYRLSAEWGVLGGAYLNSDSRVSEYAYLRWQPLAIGPVRLGGIGGVVNHYDENGGRVRGAAMLAASIDFERLNVALIGIPNIGNIDGCISLQLGLRF